MRRQIHTYFKLVDQNVLLRSNYGKNVLDVHYTSFIRQPKVWLKTICDFLEVFCSEEYLSSCVKIIFPKETYTRRYIVWPDALKKAVMRKIEQVEFLNGLSFEITWKFVCWAVIFITGRNYAIWPVVYPMCEKFKSIMVYKCDMVEM